jgi:hypothetical protein
MKYLANVLSPMLLSRLFYHQNTTISCGAALNLNPSCVGNVKLILLHCKLVSSSFSVEGKQEITILAHCNLRGASRD